MPVMNSGIELPTIISVLPVTSRFEPGFSAATTPIGIARQTTTSRLRMPRLSVAGIRRPNVSLMGNWLIVLSPRSPCRALNIQFAYRSCSGRSSPSRDLVSSIDSGVALIPTMRAAGSPGSTFISRKARMLMMIRMTIEERIRVML